MSSIRELFSTETRLAHQAMAELRPAFAHDVDGFVALVDGPMRAAGYRLFAAFDDPEADAAAVLGFRPVTSLAWGKALYVDDLSTRAAHRRRGHGRALLATVAAEARRLGCGAVHLDSGHQRHEAHRLYLAVGYRIRSHHFALDLALDPKT